MKNSNFHINIHQKQEMRLEALNITPYEKEMNKEQTQKSIETYIT